MANKEEKIALIFGKLLKVVSHMEDAENKLKVEKMLEEIMYPFAASPASTLTAFGGAYPGGLMQYSLITTSILKKLSDATAAIEIDDLVIAGLFHHLGKMGFPDMPVYVELNSDWHNKKGIMYEVNKDNQRANANHNLTSLWYLSKYGIKVSPKAFEAITAMNTKPNMPSDEFTGNELTILLLAASRLAWKKLALESNI